MDRRIAIRSARLMNTESQFIEACRLFDTSPDHVGVLIHPQSTTPSLVKVVDGSLPAHLSVTDMRLPILYALTYCDCIERELRSSV